MARRTIFMDIDGTAFKKTIVLEALKRNPRLALRLLLRRPTFYIYGALYKLTGADSLRRRVFEEIKRIPVDDFDVRKIDPEYLRILRLAEAQGHRVVFLTSNPKHIANKWAERIRNMFPRLDMEVRSVPTMEEKLRVVREEVGRKGPDLVHFFDDSLPSTGGDYNLWRMEYDKAALLKDYELELKNRKGLEHKTLESMRNARSKHIGGKDDILENRPRRDVRRFRPSGKK